MNKLQSVSTRLTMKALLLHASIFIDGSSLLSEVFAFTIFFGSISKVTSPQCEVISQKLHNSGWISVFIIFKSIKLSNSVIKCSFS